MHRRGCYGDPCHHRADGLRKASTLSRGLILKYYIDKLVKYWNYKKYMILFQLMSRLWRHFAGAWRLCRCSLTATCPTTRPTIHCLLPSPQTTAASPWTSLTISGVSSLTMVSSPTWLPAPLGRRREQRWTGEARHGMMW